MLDMESLLDYQESSLNSHTIIPCQHFFPTTTSSNFDIKSPGSKLEKYVQDKETQGLIL
jgi:hypothetical protein